MYVSPGKDVTLYVPADTPRVVIDYLNRLKDEGQFSQGVMDILIHHVTGQGSTEFYQSEDEFEHTAMLQEPSTGTEQLPARNIPSRSAFPDFDETLQLRAASPSVQFPEDKTHTDDEIYSEDQIESTMMSVAFTSENTSESPAPTPNKPPFHLKMADIFRQAQKNTGKLADARSGSGNE